MFTLIKREIEDHLAHFLAAVILSVIIVVLSIWAIYNYYRAVRPWAFPNALSTAVVVALVLALGLFAMGAGQMYMDRTRRVSAFLSVLPVSRRRILWLILGDIYSSLSNVFRLLWPWPANRLDIQQGGAHSGRTDSDLCPCLADCRQRFWAGDDNHTHSVHYWIRGTDLAEIQVDRSLGIRL